MPKDEDIWGALDDALKEEEKVPLNLKGVDGIKYYLAAGNFNAAISIMIGILQDTSPYTIGDKIAVTDICKSLIQQGYASYLRPLYPHLYMIHNHTESYLTRALPDPVLIFNVSEILTNTREIMFEEMNNLRNSIRGIAIQIKKEFGGVNKIPLRDIAHKLNLNFVIILKIVEEMIQNKEIQGHYDSVGDILVLDATEFICHNCGAEMKKEDTKCNNCGLVLKDCVICGGKIRTTPVICPKCSVPAHKEHFLEWLTASVDKKTGKGACPSCQNPLTPSDLKEG